MAEANATLIDAGKPTSDAGSPQAASTDANASSQQQTPEQKAVADKAAADKAATDKVVADKAAADKVATDAKLTPEQKAAADKAAADVKAKQGAPEKYEPFKAPEGIVLDATVTAALEATARELNLSQESAQKLVDSITPKIAAHQTTQMQETMAKARNDWATASSTDKEIGGDKFAENIGVAKKAMDAFATPELKTLLNETGLGNHPEILRAFFRVGKAISEDRLIPGTKSPGELAANASLEERAVNKLYGSTSK